MKTSSSKGYIFCVEDCVKIPRCTPGYSGDRLGPHFLDELKCFYERQVMSNNHSQERA